MSRQTARGPHSAKTHGHTPDWLSATGSLIIHGLLLLLLPSIAVSSSPPVSLLIEIVPGDRFAGGALSSEQSLAAATTSEQTEPVPSPAAPVPQPASTPQPSSPAREKPPQPQKPPSEQSTSSEQPSAVNQATDVDMRDVITAPDSPTEVADTPVVDAPAAVEVQPHESQPNVPTPTQSPTAEEKPQEADSSSDSTSTPEAAPEQSAPDSNNATSNAEPTAAANENGGTNAETSNGSTAAPAGPPAAPPGPSAAELRLLNGYGDSARLRIRSQARNPEAGAEGVVTLTFEVESKGHLVSVRVLKSSGRELLDNDALDAVRAAFNDKHEIIPFPADVKVEHWVFTMKLEYPLY